MVEKLALENSSKWISITGGEPLLHPGFVLATASKLKKEKYSLYLETNGTLPNELSKVEHYFDYFSIDIKLPADCGRKEWWHESAECLRIAGNRALAKIVVTSSTPFIEIQKAIETAVSVLPKITIVLQPASSPDMPIAVSSSRLKKILKYALNVHTNVRMIPQMHRILGWK
jgi:organic radical activating enzyme